MAVEESGDTALACRGSRCRRSPRPCCFSSSSTGASPMHGTHQLAKKLSRRGLPVARSVELRPGASGKRRRQLERRHLPVDELRADRRVVWLHQPPGEGPQNPDQQNDRKQAKRAAHRKALLRQARARVPRRGQAARQADERTAEPDQGDERLPPQPKLPAAFLVGFVRARCTAGRSEGLDRRFVGLGRRIGEEARLRTEHVDAASARRAKFGLDGRPVGTRRPVTRSRNARATDRPRPFRRAARPPASQS